LIGDASILAIVIGFFGLGVGYFIPGGQALLDFPKATPDVRRTMASDYGHKTDERVSPPNVIYLTGTFSYAVLTSEDGLLSTVA